MGYRTSDNAKDRQPELNLILGNGKHTRRKGQENVYREREREREMGKKVSMDDRSNIKMGVFKYSSRIIAMLSMFKSKFPPK